MVTHADNGSMCLKRIAVLALAIVADASILNQGGNVLKLDRATATSLMIEVPCQPFCKHKVFWEFKTVNSSEWAAITNVGRHHFYEDTYVVTNLQTNTLYYLRALLNPSGIYTPVLEARTCSAPAPPVSGAHVASAGAGWLEVRWRPPPKELCRSAFKYAVRYRAEGAPFSPTRTHGAFVEGGRFLRLRPAHPCPAWPALFCLLLVDAVKAGSNHTVEIQVVRLDKASKEDESLVQTTYGFANSSNYKTMNTVVTHSVGGPQPPISDGYQMSAAEDRTAPRPERPKDKESLAVPLWAAALGWAISAVLFIAILVMAAVGKSRKASDPSKQSPDISFSKGNEVIVPLPLQLNVSLPSHILNTQNNNMRMKLT